MEQTIRSQEARKADIMDQGYFIVRNEKKARKTRTVTNMNTGTENIFTNKTPYEAMQAMIYFLNLSSKCEAIINKTESGKHLYFDFKGETYAVRND